MIRLVDREIVPGQRRQVIMKPNAILAIAIFAAAATPVVAETSTAPVAKPANPVVAPIAAKQDAAVATTLDINTASVEQLAAAKGLDRTLAEAIVKGRPYKTTHELVKHKILSDAQFAVVKDALVVKQN
jgi:DNA uptake protein ComE-like DNA-binding protein